MAWLEIHQSLRDHRKTLEAADTLDVKPVTMMGMMVSFWLWAIDNVPDGDVSKIRPRTLARAAQWDGDPEEFIGTLVACGWLDKYEDCLLIHDWHDYVGKLLERREQENNYKKRQRALYGNMRVIKEVRRRDGDNCRYCGKEVNWDDRKGPGGGTYSFIDPEGGSRVENIIVVCRGCSSKWSNMPPEEAKAALLPPRTTVADIEATSGRNQVDNQQINGKKNLQLQYSTEQYLDIDIDPKGSMEDKPPEPPAEDPPAREPVPFKEIQDLYINICVSFPKIMAINGQRKKAVRARWNEHKDIKVFEALFRKAEASSFMKGRNDRNWTADFDWMMRPTNFIKILEGKYDDDRIGGAKNGVHSKHTRAETTSRTEEAPTLSGFRMATDPTRDPK